MRMAMLVLLAVALTLQGSAPGPAMNQTGGGDGPKPFAWTELTGAGQELRAIALDGRCPEAVIDGVRTPMRLRAPPGEGFPVAACQVLVPSGAVKAEIAGRPLPLMARPPQRILIFGDTGCRIRGDQVQDCNNTSSWPFPLVAKLAAKHRPDLIIHVGDYYYRESACPPGRQGCVGSPHGDAWDSWRADFFDPAQPLFQAAPFVFARGNHEVCYRGGQGWTRFLDAGDQALGCADTEAPYKIDIGGLNLYVIDSAESEDRAAPPPDVARIAGQLDALAPDLASKPGWIVTHRPVWAVTPFARLGPVGPAEISLDKTLQAAVRGRDLSAVSLIVSGHVHHFAAYDFGGRRPSQLVAGTGGDAAEESDLRRPRAGPRRIEGMTAQRLTFQRFGFFMMERAGAAWTGTFRDLDDQVVATCRLEGRDLTCAAVQR
ncbi:metallophosphoesterase family protein [Phenylobacterium montanum]|uniref:Metallophosphoesterase n=1 Tax=Phenylobacterium montanum TaxID=2823693 RepID=A0A975FYJ6_9CAUL|nr:metallophosphoesterase [Caulobacter sp. S6]QUD87218.1 metallophosphoesterase [Caulobacter sp. S6]